MGELGLEDGSGEFRLTADSPLVALHLHVQIVGAEVGVGDAQEEFHLTADGDFVVNLVGVTESDFQEVLRADAEVRNLVGLILSGFLHEGEELLREIDVGVGAEVEFHDVRAFESLERHSNESVFQIQRHSVVVLEVSEEVTGIDGRVHESGEGAVVHTVALPAGLHLIDEVGETEITGGADVEVAHEERHGNIAAVKQRGVHFMPIV